MNTLFCCLFLVDYLKDLLKFLFELLIVAEYQFLVFVSFLDHFVKKLMQLEVNSIEDCILEQKYSVKFLIHFESELLVIEFDIQLKFSQENSQLFSLVNEDVRHQYLRYI